MTRDSDINTKSSPVFCVQEENGEREKRKEKERKGKKKQKKNKISLHGKKRAERTKVFLRPD